MFGFIKNCFSTALAFSSYNELNAVSLKCVSMNNRICKVRPKILKLNSNESSSYPYHILVHKCNSI